jgi:hypothetical protein
MSSLDQIIPAEIKNDEFFNNLRFLAQFAQIESILEIGASSGEGSTEALILGAVQSAHKPRLFSLEVSKPRYEALAQRYAAIDQFRAYNVSSVRLEDFPSPEQVRHFHRTSQSLLSGLPVEQILGWLDADIKYVVENNVRQDGISVVRQENNIDIFGMVLIDGSEFTGARELDMVYGAKVIALDDICTYKNYTAYQRLLGDTNYDIFMLNKALRNGYAIFIRK